MVSTNRLPVPVTDEVRELIDAIRTPGTPENAALQHLAGQSLSRNSSAATALRALVEVGRKAIVEEAMLEGYEALAAARDEEDYAFTRAARRRSGEVVERQ